MKRWLWYIGVVAAIAALSGKAAAGIDVAKLQPVQVVRLTCPEGEVVLETDMGDWGMGETLKDALKDLNAAASWVYVLVSLDCVVLVAAMMKQLRPSCSVCLGEGELDMAQVGAYLQQHAPEVTLMEYRAGEHQLKTLVMREGRMKLVS